MTAYPDSPPARRGGIMLLLQALVIMAASSANAALTSFYQSTREFKHIVSMTGETPAQTRRQWFGPVYEHAEWDDGLEFSAIRPFFSRIYDAGSEHVHLDVLWPLASWRASPPAVSGRFMLVFYDNADTNDPGSQSRLWALPFYFSGRTRAREPYMAVFPIAGRLQDFFGMDEVRFLMFPVYAGTRQGDVESIHLLWPVFSMTSGPDQSRWRVFPFYGQASEKDGTRRRFVLWPIWSSVQREGTDDDGSGFVLFPLFGRVQTERQYSVMALPPFFRYSKSPRGTEIYYPWPFLQWSSGDVDKNYVWPFWGRKSSPGVDSAFFLWPLGRLGRQERGDAVAIQRTFYPVYYTRQVYSKDAIDADTFENDGPLYRIQGRPEARYEKIWPLYSYQREDDVSVFRFPDLWPGKPFAAIERNLTPFWTLYAHTKTDKAHEQELLWGLFRRRVEEEGESRTQIFPLVRWESDQDGDREISVLCGLLRFGRSGGNVFGTILSLFRWGKEERRP